MSWEMTVVRLPIFWTIIIIILWPTSTKPVGTKTKLQCFAFDCVRGLCPSYFCKFCGICTPLTEVGGRVRLRSVHRGDLCVPSTRTEFGKRSFRVAARRTWNSLPLHLRSPTISRQQFQSWLKTHLFKRAYIWLLPPRTIEEWTYLLTYLLLSLSFDISLIQSGRHICVAERILSIRTMAVNGLFITLGGSKMGLLGESVITIDGGAGCNCSCRKFVIGYVVIASFSRDRRHVSNILTTAICCCCCIRRQCIAWYVTWLSR